MKSDKQDETAGRELITSALQRNPLVALGVALISPILGFFGRRPRGTPTQVEKLKLERYSSRPMPPPPGHRYTGVGAASKVARTTRKGGPKVTRCAPEGHPKPAESAPEEHFGAANLKQGGPLHG
jgi:hypothetical protein